MSRAISSDEVAAYTPLVIQTAKRFVGVGGAEYDDLYQEGLIAVWDCLRTDFPPSEVVVRNRMIDWVRKCSRQGLSNETPKTELFD